MKTYNILLFCINQPLHYAIYDDDVLVFARTIDEKPSGALAIAFQEIEAFCENKRENECAQKNSDKSVKQERAKIGAIYYAAGPGNLSALRLTHVFLHSLAIIKGIKLYAADSFAFLPNSYIYAFGKRYFHKADSTDSTPESKAQKSKTPESKNAESAALPKPHTKDLSLDTTHGITCVLLDTPPEIAPFIAPQILPKERFTLPCEPLYILPPL